MTKKKKRSVLMSALTLLLCLALVAGGTYALFSDQVTLSTHLQAGTLNITLMRTHLVSKELDNKTGFLVKMENEEDVNFSNPTTRNVFDLDEFDKIVPGCSYDATMKITNDTDVAFAYWIEVINRNYEDIILGDQLKVTVKTEEYKKDAYVSYGMYIGSEKAPVGILAKGQSDEFNVILEFLDLANNNAAKGQNLNFDIVVHAVQVVDEPKAPSLDTSNP